MILNASSIDAKGRNSETGSNRPKQNSLISTINLWLDRGILLWIFAIAVFAPHSIAATQTAWLCGMLFWVLRFFLRPRPLIFRTPVDYALFGFFLLTGLSAFLSYEPVVSIGKLRAASLFTIVYLVAENVPSVRIVRALAVVLVASSMVNVLYTFGERAVGRGIKVTSVSQASPLFAAGIRDGDTLLEVDEQKLRAPEQLIAALETQSVNAPPARIKIYRYEWMPIFTVARGNLLPGKTALEQLGIASGSRGRDWRAMGFFGHYVTYAEALQLIISLALGLFICLPRKRGLSGLLLAMAIAGLGIALLLTVTRASWLAFLVSAFIMLLLGTSRRAILIITTCALPLILGGLFVLHQKRNVGFFDQKDDSIRWRQTVQREGLHLLLSKPRHLFIGVGMDSIKKHWREWDLFDHGRLPIGHMHSNILQLALERGVPALLLWLVLLFIYARMLWRSFRKLSKGEAHLGRPENTGDTGQWIDRGIVLGALGGLAGFFTSGLVHYNWGDSEVVMIFYFIMGLSLVVERQSRLGLQKAK
ncbi:MAG: O-antigen ligase family protein [Pyrinomonadaceae bacterium]